MKYKPSEHKLVGDIGIYTGEAGDLIELIDEYLSNTYNRVGSVDGWWDYLKEDYRRYALKGEI